MASENKASPLISPDTLEAMLTADRQGTVLVDTRPPEMWAQSHIAGAVSMHDIFTYLATSTQTGNAEMRCKFAQLFGKAGLGGAETAVIYEDQMDTGFGQSCRGYVILRYLGYPEDKLRVLDGGIFAWKAHGKPVVSAENMASETHFTHAPKTFPISAAGEHLLVDKDEFLAVVRAKTTSSSSSSSSSNDNSNNNNHNHNIILVDTRDEPEWLGKTSSPYGIDFCPRMGRVPGAVWIEWKRMMERTATGARMLRSADVVGIMAEFGISADTPVIVFCFKGARASNTLIALRDAGVKDVRLYMGSWNEWSRDPALPIIKV